MTPTEYNLGGIIIPITDRFTAPVIQSIEHGTYEALERNLLEKALLPGDRVLELGGGCGYIATVAAKRAGSRNVLTVEADPDLQATMLATFERNGVSPYYLLGAVAKDGSPRHLERAPDFWSTKTVPGGNRPGLPLSMLLRHLEPTVLVCDIEGGEADLCGEPLPGVRTVIIETHGGRVVRDKVCAWLEAEGFLPWEKIGRVLGFRREAKL